MTVTVHHGDSRDVLKTLADHSIDSCVCDPPYALVSIGKRFGADDAAACKPGKTGAYQRASAGFMGKRWDTGETAFDPAFWVEVLRVLKPGGHLIAFSGTRTYHRLACAIEDAGFEIRDQIGWLYGSGFPKSHNVAKGLARAGVEAPEWDGWGTALKPAWEPIVLARKAMAGTVVANVLQHGVGALNIDASRVGWASEADAAAAAAAACGFADSRARGTAVQSVSIGGESRDGTNTYDPAAIVGRWPANVIHDGSAEVVAAFPESAGQQGDVRGNEPSEPLGANTFGRMAGRLPAASRSDSGSAARFFYSSKADADDRLGSKHPTVKPTDLMAYLCKLVTRPGGVVLDPFAGSGSTGMACLREGFDAVLIEREAEYVADIRRRIAHVEGLDAPLFSGTAQPASQPASQPDGGFTESSRTNNRPGRTETVAA